MEREHVIMNQVNRILQTLQVTISDHTTAKEVNSVVEQAFKCKDYKYCGGVGGSSFLCSLVDFYTILLHITYGYIAHMYVVVGKLLENQSPQQHLHR